MAIANTASREIRAVLDQIVDTPGWNITYNDGKARVIPPNGVGRPFLIHLTPQSFSRQHLMKVLRHHGWTPDLAISHAENERAQRMALHAEQTERIERDIDRINKEADVARAAAVPTVPAPTLVTAQPELPFGAVWGAKPPHLPAWVKITKEWANEMILLDNKIRQEDGTLNRKISALRIQDYMREIEQNRWKKIHQGYAITRDGKILDGQHRLLAIQAVGKTVYGWVFFNVDEETFDVIDTGRPRTVADALHVDHEVNTAVLAATVRLYWLYGNYDEFEWGGTKRVSAAATRETLASHPELREAVILANRHAKLRRIMRGPAIAVAIYLALRAWPAGEQKMIEFLYGVATGNEMNGDGLRSTDPRKRLHVLMDTYRDQGKKRDARFHMAVFLKAWNLFCNGQGVTLLSVRENERIPMPYIPQK